MDEKDASAAAWQWSVSVARRHPWRVRAALASIAVPIFYLEWFVLGLKPIALAFAAATIGLVVSLPGIVARHTPPGE